MKPKTRKPIQPRAQLATIRQAIVCLLREEALSAKGLSGEIRIEEKEIYGHLDHIRRSLHGTGEVLEVTPPYCCRCGFVFSKRGRLTAPGKCPRCRHEAIADPVFSIREA